jgi:hypothetical protein
MMMMPPVVPVPVVQRVLWASTLFISPFFVLVPSYSLSCICYFLVPSASNTSEVIQNDMPGRQDQEHDEEEDLMDRYVTLVGVAASQIAHGQGPWLWFRPLSAVKRTYLVLLTFKFYFCVLVFC